MKMQGIGLGKNLWYTYSLANADSFYANFTNMAFQNKNRYMYLTHSFTYTYLHKGHTY